LSKLETLNLLDMKHMTYVRQSEMQQRCVRIESEEHHMGF